MNHSVIKLILNKIKVNIYMFLSFTKYPYNKAMHNFDLFLLW